MSVVARFEIRYSRYLTPEGKVEQPLPAFARDRSELVRLHRAMHLTRAFDRQAVALQRTGRLGTFASSLGEEAVGVGLGAAMVEDDVFVPMYRCQGTQFLRGVTMRELLLYWGGDERGMDFAGPRQDFPICVPVGSHAVHAVGVAYAIKLRKERRAVACVCGDGATSKGDFYEALNAAGVWGLPLLFVVDNNQWAISVPRSAQSHAETLAQKAVAGGIVGEQVDGNDVVAVRAAAGRLLQRAREHGEPAVLEALTYRLGDHTTADDASRYRPSEELERRRGEDPITRLRAHLAAEHGWSETDEEALRAECESQVEQAAKAYLETPPQPPTSMFDYLYAELPEAYREQRAALEARSDG